MFADRILMAISVLTLVQCTPIEINDEPQSLPEVDTPIPILSQSVDSSLDGSFSYSFETGNHIKQQANGYRKTVLVPRQRDDGSASSELGSADIIVQSGSYSYTAPDGTIISVSYIADENGFRAFGDHLPTPPPIPELILQSLQNAQNSQLAEEQPTQQLLAPQDIAIDAETATSQSDEKTRQQRSPLLPALLQ